MKITKYFTRVSQTYTINLREYSLGEIHISRHFEYGNGWSQPTVNWGGCGNVSVEQLETFEKALGIAKHLDDCLIREVNSPSLTIIDENA
jgi:hypothetical protein